MPSNVGHRKNSSIIISSICSMRLEKEEELEVCFHHKLHHQGV